jgi:uncharacterized cupin superfamily protein
LQNHDSATVIERTAPTRYTPATRLAGLRVANANQVVNRSRVPCSYLIFGSGAVPDVVHYPERGEVLHAFDDGTWRLEPTDGTLIKEGREP